MTLSRRFYIGLGLAVALAAASFAAAFAWLASPIAAAASQAFGDLGLLLSPQAAAVSLAIVALALVAVLILADPLDASRRAQRRVLAMWRKLRDFASDLEGALPSVPQLT